MSRPRIFMNMRILQLVLVSQVLISKDFSSGTTKKSSVYHGIMSEFFFLFIISLLFISLLF